MTKIQGLLFDKDGTLFNFADTWGVWIERVLAEICADNRDLVQRLARAAGYDVEQRRFIAGSLVVNAAADDTNKVWDKLLPDRTLAQIEEAGLRHLKNLPLSPVADLEALFKEVAAFNLQIGLATNDFEVAAHTHLEQLAIAHHFAFICGCDSGFGSKPEPGMISAFCQHTGLAAAAVAMVGDSTHDLLAGRAAGVGLLVGVLTGPAQQADLEMHADIVLPDISMLPAYLQNRSLL